MEEKNLLQQMEYLSRKIRMLQAQQATNSRKPTVPSNNASNRVKYWQGQTKIDNRLKHKVVNEDQISKYQLKRGSVNASSTFAHTLVNGKSPLAPLVPKTSPVKRIVDSKVPNLCYVNPHFRQGSMGQKMDQDSQIIHKLKPAITANHLGTEVRDVLVNSSSSLNKGNSSGYVTSRQTNVPLNDSTLAVEVPVVPQEPVDCPLQKDIPGPKMKVHVNRLVYPSNDEAKARVLVNPKVFARLKSEIRRESPPRLATPASRAKVKFASSSGKKSFVAVGRNKLVRVRKLSFHVTPTRARSLSTSKPISSLTKIAKSVCSKYKFIRSGSTSSKSLTRSSRKISPFVRTQYKLDRRLNRSLRHFKEVKKYSIKYASPSIRAPENNLQGIMKHKRLSAGSKSSFGNRVWAHNKSFQPTRVIITDRKLFKIGSTSTPLAKKVRRSPQSSTLLRIGGVLYKSSRNSLARSKYDSRTESTPKRDARSTVTSENRKRLKTPGGHVVHVRGHKFLMDPTGKTLKRISDSSIQLKGHLRRVDLGGATFIQKSANVLMRTNTHVVRSWLSQAKQRSISTLSKHMQKNNTVCKYFRQFGKCFRNEKNKCPCVHDKKHVAICKSHLRDACSKPDCLLSHDLIPEKMATCQHYLQLRCSRPNCPYLHIKLNDKAPLCVPFLQGYCADGLRCRKWHFNICVLFDKTGRCPKGKYCPYPHKPRPSTELCTDHMEFDVDEIMRLYQERANQPEVRKSESVVRYFTVSRGESGPDSLCTVNEESVSSENLEKPNLQSTDGVCSILGSTRKPIGYLPAFISIN